MELREGNSAAAAVEFKGIKAAEGDSLIIQVRLCLTANTQGDASLLTFSKRSLLAHFVYAKVVTYCCCIGH